MIINSNNTIVNALSSNSLNTINKTLVGAINENKSDIDTIKNILPNLASQSYVDQKFNGAAKAISFDSYATMITAFNALTDDVYVSGQNINVLTLEVPDLWVYEVDSTRIPYTYVDDATFVNELSTNGYVQVGFYKLAMLETQKVDLTDYQEKLTTTSVSSGTITESIGFNANNELVRGSASGGQYNHRINIYRSGYFSFTFNLINNDPTNYGNNNQAFKDYITQYYNGRLYVNIFKQQDNTKYFEYEYIGNAGNFYGYSHTLNLNIDFDNKTSSYSFQQSNMSQSYMNYITDTVTPL